MRSRARVRNVVRATLAAITATGVLAAFSVTPASARQESWYHNGSEMTWTSLLGWRQVIKYREPREEVGEKGAHAGSPFFSGWRYGNRLYGRARTFRAGCAAPFAYKVRGIVSEDRTRAVLHGLSPIIEDCRIVGYRAFGRDATLVLIKMS